jgi:hypothetical protein
MCAADIEKRVRSEDQRVAGLLGNVRKSFFNLAIGAGL